MDQTLLAATFPLLSPSFRRQRSRIRVSCHVLADSSGKQRTLQKEKQVKVLAKCRQQLNSEQQPFDKEGTAIRKSGALVWLHAILKCWIIQNVIYLAPSQSRAIRQCRQTPQRRTRRARWDRSRPQKSAIIVGSGGGKTERKDG